MGFNHSYPYQGYPLLPVLGYTVGSIGDSRRKWMEYDRERKVGPLSGTQLPIPPIPYYPTSTLPSLGDHPTQGPTGIPGYCMGVG